MYDREFGVGALGDGDRMLKGFHGDRGIIHRAEQASDRDARLWRTVGLVSDGQDGAIALPKDAFGDGAEHHAAQPTAPVRAHDDEVGPVLSRCGEDGSRGRVFHELRLGGDRFADDVLNVLSQMAPRRRFGALQGVEQLLDLSEGEMRRGEEWIGVYHEEPRVRAARQLRRVSQGERRQLAEIRRAEDEPWGERDLGFFGCHRSSPYLILVLPTTRVLVPVRAVRSDNRGRARPCARAGARPLRPP
ncbi:hypothetical protein HRbin10_02484 [bacterium HR10]|nr:hypothetical protein HRbin10_02484 [bacterium HR10]